LGTGNPGLCKERVKGQKQEKKQKRRTKRVVDGDFPRRVEQSGGVLDCREVQKKQSRKNTGSPKHKGSSLGNPAGRVARGGVEHGCAIGSKKKKKKTRKMPETAIEERGKRDQKKAAKGEDFPLVKGKTLETNSSPGGGAKSPTGG